jgi:hypothetical protein
MNVVHGRLNVLERLWTELGTYSEDDGVVGTVVNSEKACLKLKVWSCIVLWIMCVSPCVPKICLILMVLG